MIKKSGEMSCCGRGGSWFGKCGSVMDTKFDHTWYEGFHACKTRSQSNIVIGQKLKGIKKARDDASNDTGNAVSKVGIATIKLFEQQCECLLDHQSRL